ncbi:MAG TPA: hypothetical protein VEW05_11930 [Candidatus Polarisedimenticolia bacterium]|nr:hypothetical protein [Candidatus Polarisedimenticolia bacterium]
MTNIQFIKCAVGVLAGSTVIVDNGLFSQGTNPAEQPVITSAPVYKILPIGSDASFSVTMAQGRLSYQWYRDFTLVTGATNTSLTLTSVQLSSNGSYKVIASSRAGTASPAARLVVLDASAWVIWTNYIAHTNSKSSSLWTTYSHPIITNAPSLAWNTNCLLYGMTGFTAISQANSFQGNLAPVTALTKRHGYTAGHVIAAPGSDGFNGHADTKVWFCTAFNQVVEMTNVIAYVRYTNGYDYTIFIFTEDLTNTITPLSVMNPPGSIGVQFTTSHYGWMSANMPPFYFGETSKPPFNEQNTSQNGDSGSPNMIPMPDGSLVFMYGTSTSGPSVQMQKDMDFLCTNTTFNLNLNITNYQLNWYNYNL